MSDPPKPSKATFKLRIDLRGGHVHADVFAGPPGSTLALTGRLVMTIEEWQCFESALILGARRVPFGTVVVQTEGPFLGG